MKKKTKNKKDVILLKKARCLICGELAIVANDGEILCCNISGNVILKGNQIIRRPTYTLPKKWQEDVLKIQENKCAYCDKPFGAILQLNDSQDQHQIEIKIHWDHNVPLCKGGDNTLNNFRACCQFCNRFKGRRVFRDITEIRSFVKEKWNEYNKRFL